MMNNNMNNYFYYTIAELNKNVDSNFDNNKLKLLQINIRGMNVWINLIGLGIFFHYTLEI